MQIKLQRSIAAVIGWVITNRLVRIRAAGFFISLPQRTERQKLSVIDAEILHILNQTLRDGHTRFPVESLIARVEAELGANRALREATLDAINRLQSKGQIRLYKTHVALTKCVVAEETVANGFACIGCRARPIKPVRLAQLIESSAAQLSDDQCNAVLRLINDSVSILTGAPGTGKTVTIKALIDIFDQAGYGV